MPATCTQLPVVFRGCSAEFQGTDIIECLDNKNYFLVRTNTIGTFTDLDCKKRNIAGNSLIVSSRSDKHRTEPPISRSICNAGRTGFLHNLRTLFLSIKCNFIVVNLIKILTRSICKILFVLLCMQAKQPFTQLT